QRNLLAITHLAACTMSIRPAARDRQGHWSDSAHAASWFPRIGDSITGGGRGACCGRPRSGSYVHQMRGVVVSVIRRSEEVAMSTSRRTPKTLHVEGLPTIFPNAAGIDIGADEIVVAV